ATNSRNWRRSEVMTPPRFDSVGLPHYLPARRQVNRYRPRPTRFLHQIAGVDSGAAVSTSSRAPEMQGTSDQIPAGGKKEMSMRFLSMIRIDETRGQVPSEQLMQDMGKLIGEMTREGTLVRTAGLRPSAQGVRVRLQKGNMSMVDGPFTETKEVIGGFA